MHIRLLTLVAAGLLMQAGSAALAQSNAVIDTMDAVSFSVIWLS